MDKNIINNGEMQKSEQKKLKVISDKVKEFKNEKNYNVRQLSEYLEVDRGVIERLLGGKDIRGVNLLAIADKLPTLITPDKITTAFPTAKVPVLGIINNKGFIKRLEFGTTDEVFVPATIPMYFKPVFALKSIIEKEYFYIFTGNKKIKWENSDDLHHNLNRNFMFTATTKKDYEQASIYGTLIKGKDGYEIWNIQTNSYFNPQKEDVKIDTAYPLFVKMPIHWNSLKNTEVKTTEITSLSNKK